MALMAYEKLFGAQESYEEKWKDDWDSERDRARNSEWNNSKDGFCFKKDGFFQKDEFYWNH